MSESGKPLWWCILLQIISLLVILYGVFHLIQKTISVESRMKYIGKVISVDIVPYPNKTDTCHVGFKVTYQDLSGNIKTTDPGSYNYCYTPNNMDVASINKTNYYQQKYVEFRKSNFILNNIHQGKLYETPIYKCWAFGIIIIVFGLMLLMMWSWTDYCVSFDEDWRISIIPALRILNGDLRLYQNASSCYYWFPRIMSWLGYSRIKAAEYLKHNPTTKFAPSLKGFKQYLQNTKPENRNASEES